MRNIDTKMSWQQFLGCSLIIAGSALGGGMLALPIVCAKIGFAFSLMLFIFFWIVMVLSALCILEVCFSCDVSHSSFASMAKQTLGITGKVITVICLLCLLYSTVAAYLSGGSALIVDLLMLVGIKISLPVSAIMMTIVFATIVFCGTKYIDYFMRFFLFGKGILFIIFISLLLPKVNIELLTHIGHKWNDIAFAIPIIMTAFGFHFVIPSLRLYVGDKPKKLSLIIIFGASLPLIVYTVWVFVTLGIVPLVGDASFTTVAQNNNSLSVFTNIVIKSANNSFIVWVYDFFVNIAITTSLLGVSLGLFDFLAELSKRKNNFMGRFQTSILTFGFPFIFAVFFPDGFVLALVYSAIFGAFLELILPVLMVLQLRRSRTTTPIYQAPVNSFFLFIIFMIGVVVIILSYSAK